MRSLEQHERSTKRLLIVALVAQVTVATIVIAGVGFAVHRIVETYFPELLAQ